MEDNNIFKKNLDLKAFKVSEDNPKEEPEYDGYSDDDDDIFEMKDFISLVECGGFTPDDGSLQVFIDGKPACIAIMDWGCYYYCDSPKELSSIYDIEKLEGHVQIHWFNK